MQRYPTLVAGFINVRRLIHLDLGERCNISSCVKFYVPGNPGRFGQLLGILGDHVLYSDSSFLKFLEHGLSLRLLFDQIGASLRNAFGLLNEFLTHPFELCDILDAL
jgi:hypothetical protein